jgi:glutamate-1-semialdehyde 2,1-aminomutase
MTMLTGLHERFAAAFPRSRELHQRALRLFPDGVTHDLRRLEPFPIAVERAAGSRKWTVDGRELVDFWAGHGALLLGHSHPAIVEAVRAQVERATHPSACHALEVEWGEWVQRLIPSAERLRFTSSGTEATLMALRLARLHTGSPRFLKFAGHFHGWNDFVAPAANFSDRDTPPGVAPEVARLAVVVDPNDPDLVERTLRQHPDIGAVILEPTGGHFGTVPVRSGFLHALRDITTRLRRLLVFDEVITGFRVHPGGAQAHYGVVPDLTTLAKVLAGGLPGGCVAGRADLLDHLATRPGSPKMHHPGTFNANPLSASAGIAALRLVADGTPCQRANAIARTLRRRLNRLFAERSLDWAAYGDFSTFKLLPHFHDTLCTDDSFIPYDGDPARLEAPSDPRLVHAFRAAMLLHGVDLPGLGGMTTTAHDDADVDAAVNAVSCSIDLLRTEGLAV